MNWDDYRIFLNLARAGSFSGAARALHVDHTTVARRITALETNLGIKLIERLPKDVKLTATGVSLAQLGAAVEEAIASVERAASGAGNDLAGTVHISAPPGFSSMVLAPKIKALRHQYPDIDIILTGEKDFANLNKGEADIALRLSRPNTPSLVARKLCDVPFFFFASHTYETSEEHWEFIGYHDQDNSLPQQVWLHSRLGTRKVVFRSSDAHAQVQACASSVGVALLPDYLGDNDSRLRRLNSALSPPTRELWMLVHDDLRRAPRVRAVMDFLISVLTTSTRTTS